MALVGGATLTWTANGEVDLDGYKVYRTQTSGVYGTGTDAGLTTTYSFHSFPTHGRWFFAITAYDTSDNESAKSTEVSKFITPVIWIG